MTDKILLSCCEISEQLIDFFVETTHEEICSVLNNIYSESDEMIKYIEQRALKNLTKYKRCCLITLFRVQNKVYQDFCNDVAIYYVCRFKLNNEKIPIVKRILD